MEIVKASIEDLPEILSLQKLAYRSEAEIYNDFTIRPLTQSLEEIYQEFNEQLFFKTMSNRKIIASVRASMRNCTCYIGKLIVHPDFQNKGIGKELMNYVETYFNKAKRYELFTGNKSHRNLHFYKRLGYEKFGEKIITEDLTLVYMEKLSKSVCP